jgi:hypothetical protein
VAGPIQAAAPSSLSNSVRSARTPPAKNPFLGTRPAKSRETLILPWSEKDSNFGSLRRGKLFTPEEKGRRSIKVVLKGLYLLARDQRFESSALHQPVQCEPHRRQGFKTHRRTRRCENSRETSVFDIGPSSFQKSSTTIAGGGGGHLPVRLRADHRCCAAAQTPQGWSPLASRSAG